MRQECRVILLFGAQICPMHRHVSTYFRTRTMDKHGVLLSTVHDRELILTLRIFSPYHPLCRWQPLKGKSSCEQAITVKVAVRRQRREVLTAHENRFHVRKKTNPNTEIFHQSVLNMIEKLNFGVIYMKISYYGKSPLYRAKDTLQSDKQLVSCLISLLIF